MKHTQVVIEIEDRWDAPWALVVALYIYKMENTGEAESIDRVRVELDSKPTASSHGSKDKDNPSSCSEPSDVPDDPESEVLGNSDSDSEEFFDAAETLPVWQENSEDSRLRQQDAAPQLPHLRRRRAVDSRSFCCGWKPSPKPNSAALEHSPGQHGSCSCQATPTGVSKPVSSCRHSSKSNLLTTVAATAVAAGKKRWLSGSWEYEISYTIPWILQKVLLSSRLT